MGPKVLAVDGVIQAFNILLASLPTTWTTQGRIWVYAQSGETSIIQQEVRQWMSLLSKTQPMRKVPIIDSPTEDKIKEINYSLGLWVPEADKAKVVINRALDKGTPFACIIPGCLVNLIPDTPKHKETINESSKIVLLSPELTWIIIGIPSIKEHQVLSMETLNVPDVSFGDLEDFRGIIKESPNWNFREWVPLQDLMIRQHPEEYPNDEISSRASDGSKLYTPDLDLTLAIVPDLQTCTDASGMATQAAVSRRTRQSIQRVERALALARHEIICEEDCYTMCPLSIIESQKGQGTSTLQSQGVLYSKNQLGLRLLWSRRKYKKVQQAPWVHRLSHRRMSSVCVSKEISGSGHRLHTPWNCVKG